MDTYTYKKIEKIHHHFKKDNLVLELELLEYEGYNIYVRVDYLKKYHNYRITWYDLDLLNDNDIKKNMSIEYLSEEELASILHITERILPETYDDVSEEETDNIVVLNINYKGREYHYRFCDYISKKTPYLAKLFTELFESLPKKLNPFLSKLFASLAGNTVRYEYKKEFSFDLFNDDLSTIFNEYIMARGEKYYNEGRVKFLEEINDRYVGIVEGDTEYLVIIKYNKETKKVQVYCSCPCEFYCKHVYAIILAIRAGIVKKFYKIIYDDGSLSAIEKIFTFDYELCLGIDNNYFKIVGSEGNIELIPIFDEDDKCNFHIFEDDEELSLGCKLQRLIKNVESD